MSRKVLHDLERLEEEKWDEMQLCKAQGDAHYGFTTRFFVIT